MSNSFGIPAGVNGESNNGDDAAPFQGNNDATVALRLPASTDPAFKARVTDAMLNASTTTAN